VALITLNPEELAKLAHEHGIIVTDPAALAKHPTVIERVFPQHRGEERGATVLREDQEVRDPARGFSRSTTGF